MFWLARRAPRVRRAWQDPQLPRLRPADKLESAAVTPWEVLVLAAEAARLEVLALAGLRRARLSPEALETLAAPFALVGLRPPGGAPRPAAFRDPVAPQQLAAANHPAALRDPVAPQQLAAANHPPARYQWVVAPLAAVPQCR